MKKEEVILRSTATLDSQPAKIDFGLGGEERFVRSSDVVIDREVLTCLLELAKK